MAARRPAILPYTSTLKAAIRWIANEDEPMWRDEADVAGMMTVALVADVFGVDRAEVAQLIVLYRVKYHDHKQAEE